MVGSRQLALLACLSACTSHSISAPPEDRTLEVGGHRDVEPAPDEPADPRDTTGTAVPGPGDPTTPASCPVVGRPTALCATFDGAPLERGFAVRAEENGAVLSLVPSPARSAPSSLLVSVPADRSRTRAYLFGAVGKPRSKISLSAFVQVERVSAVTTLLQLEFGRDEIKVRAAESRMQFRETLVGNNGGSDTVVTDEDIPALAANVWTRVEIHVDLEATSSKATVTFDDVTVIERAVHAHEHLEPVELKVGSITDVTVTRAFTLRFDDVVVEHD